MDQVNNVLSSIVQGASTSLDPSVRTPPFVLTSNSSLKVKRICFMSLKKLIEGWGMTNEYYYYFFYYYYY